MATVLRWLIRLLLTIAALCLSVVASSLAEQWYYRAAARTLSASLPVPVSVEDAGRFDVRSAPQPVERITGFAPVAGLTSPPGLIGELDVPHLRIATAIVEGDDATALRRGAGHLPGSAMPGDSGNVVLAGHRDTVFRRLGELARGDRLRLTTRRGVFHYRVAQTLRVRPEDTWVLNRHAAALTLITCYPFDWIGSAPERWIVQAESIDAGAVAPTAR